jgi:hypothetical protein
MGVIGALGAEGETERDRGMGRCIVSAHKESSQCGPRAQGVSKVSMSQV